MRRPSLPENVFYVRKINRPNSGDYPGDGYRVLANPYPIFARHLRFLRRNTPQSIADRYGDMLVLALLRPGGRLYNGPRCGASAPDHAHFQAVGKGAMPLEAEVGRFATEKVLEASGAAAYAIRDYLRGADS